MKKTAALIAACVLVVPFMLANAGGADCDNVVGVWKFDLGGGHMATVEYLASGRFIQKMGKLNLEGTYTLEGRNIRARANGRNINFTIMSCSDTTMTVRRSIDSKTLLYRKEP